MMGPMKRLSLSALFPGLPAGRVAAAILITAAIVWAGVYSYYRFNLRPVGQGSELMFEVKPGQRAPEVARELERVGLIRSSFAFLSYVNLHGLRTELKAGTYSISPYHSTQRIVARITSGQVNGRLVTVPEGYRIRQIEELAAKQGIPREEFRAALAAPHDYPFLASKPAGVSLEGYLFPETYDLGPKPTAQAFVDQMLSTFGKKVGPEYTRAFAAHGLTLHQGLTIASIVEKEVSIPADRPVVAQVLLKRAKIGMPLGADPTTAYAAEMLGVPFDVTLDHPYNTRQVKGIPPGPIASPGLSALDAVARPAATDYLYFLSGNDGKTYFARSYAEHNRNIAQHLQ